MPPRAAVVKLCGEVVGGREGGREGMERCVVAVAVVVARMVLHGGYDIYLCTLTIPRIKIASYIWNCTNRSYSGAVLPVELGSKLIE